MLLYLLISANLLGLLYCANLRGSVDCTVSQIHLAQGKTPVSMIVSWMTPSFCSTDVVTNHYGIHTYFHTNTPPSIYSTIYNGEYYTSGYFHHIEISGLMPNMKYNYQCGDVDEQMSPIYSFTTPPSIQPSEPIMFGIIGDLGQTSYSQTTIQHLGENPHIQMVLHAGDLSYADCNQPLWDSYADMIQPLSRRMPWMVCAGNHEIEYNGNDYAQTFLAFQTRYRMPQTQPYELGSVTIPSAINPYTSKPYCNPSIFQMEYNYGNSFYSFESGPAHIIYLNPYSLTSPQSPQYKWLVADFSTIDRSTTPWIIVVMHCPWYSSNKNHYGDTQTVLMRDSMETLFYDNKVNIVFSGHVHAYERSYPVYLNKTDPRGPVYITIGDGGNLEGHDTQYVGQPEWSAFRNGTQYGYGTLSINNDKMVWKWYRNIDKQMVFRDMTVMCNVFIKNANCM
jgi:hypothetical protein